ncbi:UDP-N-acetylmuramoyl-tripeptide--D-alanyl-D-alanine ligase [uncultured Desulfobacterium sp.]|uniref:UDP-N-acetylmuramoyl-tripeptide--D-alanyl-D-alanine ligase n=1 Tax=uncultured Desulfobacterium sp. TaxID=201089 RepID=A0A445MW67_9BACT|nr:UDP-N-acetylmuramoyl-tripeptide--D-alanyl-D-alanine ligase [uncultured Desulfobacterium sp.]
MSAQWGKITAEEVLGPIKGRWISGKRHTVFSGLSTDSRNIRQGDLFWALRGERFDGHDFAQKAFDQGAAGAVVEGDYAGRIIHSNNPAIIAVDDGLKALGDLAGWWRHQHNVRVAAITGSAGKTTTKDMTACILKIRNNTLVTQGNLNNLIGLPLTLFRLDSAHQKAVLEMGMNRFGEIARLTEIAGPDVGAITNVGMAHIEGLGSIQGVARAKVELVEKISSKAKMVINGDDGLLMETAARFGKDITTFGLGKGNNVRASEITNRGHEGSSFRLNYHGESIVVNLNVPGIQNISNALAAAAICICLGEHPEDIARGLYSFTGVKGRFSLIHLNGGITVVDDTYNANPSSLKAALASVAAMVNQRDRIIVGLGEMMELGDAAVKAHLDAGRMVAELGGRRFVAIGEHAREMVKGAVESGMGHESAVAVETHDQMVRLIKDDMREGDLIFLKGSRKMDLGKVVDGLNEQM